MVPYGVASQLLALVHELKLTTLVYNCQSVTVGVRLSQTGSATVNPSLPAGA